MSTQKCFICKSDNTIMSFDILNNVIIPTGLTYQTLTQDDFCKKGFDHDYLNKSFNYRMYDFIDSGISGGEPITFANIPESKIISIGISEYDVYKASCTVDSFAINSCLSDGDTILTITDAKIPQIQDISITPNSTHNSIINISCTIGYLWKTQSQIRVKIADNYISEWTTLRNSNEKITLNVEAKNFKIGENSITIEVRSSDSKTNNIVIPKAVTLLDNIPQLLIINTDSTQFSIHATITDADVNDTVRYQISIINSKCNKILLPWTTFSAPPCDITYMWNSSDIVPDVENIIRIEYADNYGKGASYDYKFIGTYDNLIFESPDNKYYSTDTGVVLMEFKLGDVVAGTIGKNFAIKVKNNTIKNIVNLKISTEMQNDLKGVELQLSKTSNPFNASCALDYSQNILKKDEDLTFYVRMASSPDASGNSKFKIIANFDKAE